VSFLSLGAFVPHIQYVGHNKNKSQMPIEPKENIFDLQWELLKQEMAINKSSIEQMHEFGKTIKNWTILLWAASIGGALTQEGFTQYIIFITAIPLLLWFVEASYRKIQSKFLFRWDEIKEFVNSEGLLKSKKEGSFVGFQLLDVLGTDINSPEYKKMTRLGRIMRFKSMYIFYGSLSLFTVIIWLLTFVFHF